MLDAHQKEAAETHEARVLCLASPGAGKTRTLIARLQYMVEEMKISPSRIVAISFTRHSAGEMRNRLPASCDGVNISTLHAFALRLLMEHGEAIGYESSWLSVVSDEDVMLDEREVLADLGIIRKKPDGKWDWRKCRMKDWYAFRDGICNGSIEKPEEANPLLWKAWSALLSRLRSQNVLTFGTILYESLNLLKDRKVLRYYRRKYNHFLLDESQDTSHSQWGVIFRFIEAAHPQTFWACGDIDQAIYRWNGSDPSLLIDFAGKEDTTVYKLETCYRFGGEIAEACNRLIRHNVERLDKDIIPADGLGGLFHTHENMPLSSVVELINSYLMNEPVQPGDIAVLCRQHKPLQKLKDILDAEGIDNVKIGRLNALRQTSEYRAVMGYIRLAVNMRDRSAFMAVTAAEGLSEHRIIEIRRGALGGGSLAETFRPRHDWPTTIPEIRHHLAKVDPHGDYNEALDFLLAFQMREGCSSMQQLLFRIGLSSMQDEIKENPDKVTLCTGHAGKGLEWPIVIVIAMNEGVFPSRRSENEGRLEEERSLAYVAISRAEKACHLVHTVSPDELVPREPSRFMGEARA